MIPVVIQAVRPREPMVNYLLHHLPHATVYWDDDDDPMEAFLASLTNNAHIHLEDDVTLTVDFIAKAEREIGQGYAVVQFFSRLAEDMVKGTRIRHGGTFMSLLATYFPARTGDALKEFYHSQWKDRFLAGHPNGYDKLVSDFLRWSNRKYLTVVPSLVQHTSLKSTLGPRSSNRYSKTFKDPELRNHPYPERVPNV